MKRLNKFLSIVLLLTMVSSNTFIVTAQSLTQPTRLDSQTTSSQLPGDSPEDKGIDLPSQPILESDKGKIIGPVEPALPTDPVKDPITPPPVFTTRVPIETTQTPEPSQEPTEATPEEPQPTTTPTPEAPGEQLIDVTAIVKWSFGPSTRPTIWLKLYRNVQGGPVTAVEDAPVKMLSGSATMATWAKMPSADENGKKYEYSVKQVDASGNPLILDAYTTSISGLTVMNVFKTGQTKTIVANLVWKDNPLAKGGIIDWLAHKLEAPTVYFQLMQVSGESTIPTVVPGAPLIMMESGTLQASWPNMPVEDADRNLITYSVKQVDASGQPFSPKGFTTTEDGLTVTNVYTDPAGFGQIMGVPNPIACGPFSPQAGYTVTFPITSSTNNHTILKLMWVSGDRYHIAVVATHATQSATINGVSLNFDGSCDIGVSLVLAGVTYPATGTGGNTKDNRWVIYSAPLSNLNLSYTGNSLYVQGIGGGHNLNTSFGVSINKIAVTATKVWVGGMEDSVTAYLMVDGVRDETSGKTLAASEWKATWTDLYEITPGGRFIIYSVQEDPVPAGYEVSYSGGPYNHTITNTKKATLELKKIWVGTPGSVYLNIGTTEYGTEIASQLTTDTILTTGPKPVAPGTYYFSETNGPNTDLSDYISTFNCTVTPAGANVNAVMPSIIMPDNIVLEAGESAVCTYTNTQRAKIVVDKVTEPAGSRQSFSFTTSGSGYNNFSLKDTDPANSQIVDSGHYTVSETVPPGWKQKSAVCVSSIGSAQAPDNINIVAGETVTCTFTNTQRGKIIVRKVTNPDTDTTTSFNFLAFGGAYTNFSLVNGGSNEQVLPPGDYSFAEAMKNGWELTGNTCTSSIAGKTQVSTAIALEAGEVVDCTITNTKYGRILVEKKSLPFWSLKEFEFTGDIIGSIFNGRVLSTDNLLPGTYTTTEVAKDGWKLTDITCNDNGKSSGDVETRTATYDLKAGEEIRCVFTNTQLGEISIAKVTDPSGATQKFDFTGLFDGVSLGNGETSTKTFLDPGEYNFAESPVNGWELTSIYCRNLTPPPQLCDLTAAAGITGATVDLDNRSVSVDLQPSDNFLCTFTNKYTGGDPIDINGIKTWTGVPEGAALPAITIRLWQNNVEIDSIELTGEPWTYSFLGLPTYDMDGQIYRYKVTEDPINGYQTVQDGYNFENIYDGGSGTPTEISGKKTWVVPEGSELPASITIRLHRDGVEVAQQTITAPWNYIFSGLPTFDTDGKPFVYTVSEDPIPGYDTVQTGYDFKNTYDPELIDVSGIKTWTVPEGSKLPASITIRLYRDGTEIDSKAVNDPWTYSFTGLPKHGTNGIEYVYTVTEDPIPGYTTEQDGYNFENIYNGGFGIPTEVTAVKVWVGGPQTHPTIQFQLYRNGVKLGAPITLVNGVTSFTWTGLESLDTQGNPYVYTVDEVFVPANYVKSVSGLTITNTYRSPEIPYTGDDQVALIAGLIALFGLIGFVSMRLLKKKYQAD